MPHGKVDDWYAYAACQEQDVNLFYPRKHLKAITAKAICARCPVTKACLDEALRRNDQNGVWGGMSPEDRKSYKRALKAQPELHTNKPILAKAAEKALRRD